MLDQLATSGISPITGATVRDLLGYSSAEEITTLSQAIAAGNPRAALETIGRLETAGAQAGQVTLQLIELWRQVLLTAAGARVSPSSETGKLAAAVPAARSAQIVEVLLEVMRSHWPQLALEAAVVKLTASMPTATPGSNPAPAAPSPIAASPARPTHSTAPAAREAPAAKPSPQPDEPAAPTVGALRAELWPKVLVILKSQNNSLCALLQMYPVDFSDGEVTIKPRFNFHRDLFLKPANRTIIEAAAAKVYGRPVKVSARTDEASQKPKSAHHDSAAELVSSALEILGGEIVD